VKQFGIEFTPTFILFDAAGKEQWRGVGQLDAAQIRARLTGSN
jgi:thioredoxin-related protein